MRNENPAGDMEPWKVIESLQKSNAGTKSSELARYIYEYIEEERERGNTELTIDMLEDAVDAFEGGAR